MKIFISWSGERSRQVAELFKVWLKCVIQACDPWVSTQDIESGSWWFTEIGNQLAETSIGIICLTNENKDKPWILFEAGALTKGLSTSRVIPFLVDLAPQDLQPPLSQLNGVTFDRQSLYKLVRTVNSQLKDAGLNADVFDRVFDTYWPQFEDGFKEIINSTPVPERSTTRDDKDILSEILLTVRGFDNRVKNLESSLSIPSDVLLSTPRRIGKTQIYLKEEMVRKEVKNFINETRERYGVIPGITEILKYANENFGNMYNEEFLLSIAVKEFEELYK